MASPGQFNFSTCLCISRLSAGFWKCKWPFSFSCIQHHSFRALHIKQNSCLHVKCHSTEYFFMHTFLKVAPLSCPLLMSGTLHTTGSCQTRCTSKQQHWAMFAGLWSYVWCGCIWLTEGMALLHESSFKNSSSLNEWSVLLLRDCEDHQYWTYPELYIAKE